MLLCDVFKRYALRGDSPSEYVMLSRFDNAAFVSANEEPMSERKGLEN